MDAQNHGFTPSHIALLILIFGPIPFLYLVGERGIQGLEDRDFSQRQESASQEVKEWFGLRLGDFSTWQLSKPLEVTAGANPFQILIDSASVFDLPFLPREGVDRQGVENLGELTPWLAAGDPKVSAMARIAAIQVIAGRGQEEFVATLSQQVEERFELLESSDVLFLNHWLKVAKSRDQERVQALGEWGESLMGRVTSSDEMAVISAYGKTWFDSEKRMRRRRIGKRIASVPALDPMSPRLWVFAEECYLQRGTQLQEVLDFHRSIKGEGFVVDPTDRDSSDRIGSWDVRFEGVVIRASLPPSELFGGFSARLILVSALGIYGILALLVARTLALQIRRAHALAHTRGELIAQVTHELRTPLSVLRMYAETLRGGKLPDVKKSQYVDQIAQESYRLEHAIDRVAEVARGEQTDEPQLIETSISDLVHEIVDSFRPLIESEAITVEGELDEYALADGEKVRSILTILIENAERYGVPPIRLQLENGGGEIRVYVRDQGVGLSPEDESQVFERWTRGSASRKSGRRGIGMGLALARTYAETMGGTLTWGREESGSGAFILALSVASNTGEPSQ